MPPSTDLLMDGYDSGTGLIGGGWWTSAVALSTVMTYQQTTGDTSYNYAISGAFTANKGSNFENSYLDDTGWWALAWVQSYDITGDVDYLHMAETDAAYIHGYWLFLELTAALHNRVAGGTTYLGWANAEWSWFNGSGMINGSHLINDGLNGSCQNNGQTAWTYNQGVVLAGLSELARATGNNGLLSIAETLANASTAYFSHNGVVVEPCEPNCGADGPSFKGVYVRGLRTLASAAGTTAYDAFLQSQASCGTLVGLAPGTSPAIAALPGGGFQTVFSASGGSNTLWRYGVGPGSYTGPTPVGLAAGTSPAAD